MEKLFNKYGIKLDNEKLERFEKYYDLLIEYNQKFNITAVTEREEVYIKHFVDSLLGRELLISGKVIDVGSGGGFPAIPLKIFNGDLELTMVEATGKKCEFLRVVCDSLGLKKVNVINGRAEDLAKDEKFRESFDYCTARAVARLNSLSEYCMPLVKKGGYFIAYKGDAKEELEEGLSAIKILGGKIEKRINLELEGAKRDIIAIKKVNVTDKKYPRANGLIRKKPL